MISEENPMKPEKLEESLKTDSDDNPMEIVRIEKGI